MTYLDFTILGLIYQKPATGYEIRKVFETTALGNFSSSPGSIYPALKKLQKLKMVLQKDNELGRTLFFITDSGEDALKSWLTTEIERSDIAKNLDIILLRFAFMEDLATQNEIVRFLEVFRRQLKKYVKELKEFHQIEKNDMKKHGRLAFEHGIESYQTTLRWINRTLKTIK